MYRANAKKIVSLGSHVHDLRLQFAIFCRLIILMERLTCVRFLIAVCGFDLRQRFFASLSQKIACSCHFKGLLTPFAGSVSVKYFLKISLANSLCIEGLVIDNYTNYTNYKQLNIISDRNIKLKYPI